MSQTSYETPSRRYRAAAAPPPASPTPARCDDCGRPARHRGERADLAIDWILPGPHGPQTGHFCRDCVPTGPVADLSCIRCASGPLLAGSIAERPERAAPLLTAAGWQLTGPTCPACAPPGTTTPPAPRLPVA